MKYLVLVFWCSSLFSCGASRVSTKARPSDYSEQTTPQESKNLFPESAELSDEAILDILNYRVYFPKTMRVAVLELSRMGWQTQVNDDVVHGFFGVLNNSSRVYDASYLPKLLISRNRSIANLRLAAARYQADFLLIYTTRCQSFQDYNLFDANRTKSYCTIEAVGVDVRSGIIPFSSVATHVFLAEENSEKEVNFRETILKAKIKAISKGLEDIGRDLKTYLEKAPKEPLPKREPKTAPQNNPIKSQSTP